MGMGGFKGSRGYPICPATGLSGLLEWNGGRNCRFLRGVRRASEGIVGVRDECRCESTSQAQSNISDCR